jgi:uncharacterized protein YdeI (YjbR/CyaY-like superfamily)
MKKTDEASYKKYFAPRRKGSRWSEKNKTLVAKLIGEKRMAPPGLAVIERAKKDGTWQAVHDRTIPDERFQAFEKLLHTSPAALANFRAMPKSAQGQFVGLYFDAKKEETRIKRLAQLIDLLEQNKTPMQAYEKGRGKG